MFAPLLLKHAWKLPGKISAESRRLLGCWLISFPGGLYSTQSVSLLDFWTVFSGPCDVLLVGNSALLPDA